MCSPNHNQNNEEECAVQLRAQAVDRCSAAGRFETQNGAAAGHGRECPIYR